MKYAKRLVRTHVRSWQRSFKASAIWIGAIALILILTSSSAWSQTLNIPGLNLQQGSPLTLSKSNSEDVETGEVRLDGYNLSTIAAPTLNHSNQQTDTSPIRERISGIEDTLERVANSDFDPKTLSVTADIDESSNLPVISVNGQYLMTVTTLDAQLQVQEPDRWAERLTQIIRRALLRAQRERQTAFLARQAAIAAGIVVAVLVLSWAIARLQYHLKLRKIRLEAQIPSNADVSAQPSDHGDAAVVTALRNQQTKRHVHDLNDVRSRLLRVLQVGLWGGGLFVIIGLFPYTRWLQPVVLSAPLKILGIIGAVYLLIRVSDVLIDRFSGALAEGSFIDPESYKRLTLRVTTFSRVLKSGAAVAWVVIGIMASLSVVGVDLIPLLAGAGIIGLAISFAAQSLIKDMINGFLILLEDQYAVGDVIIVGQTDNVAGLVENMNLRITQLRNNEGRLITIPNSSIGVVQNLSKDWSRVDLAVELAFGTNPDHALNLIRQLADEMYRDRQWRSKMPDPPEVLGIDELNHTGLLIRIWLKTLPLEQWSVAREFRRRLALMLEQEHLAIGIPQQSLYFTSSLDLELEKQNGGAIAPKP